MSTSELADLQNFNALLRQMVGQTSGASQLPPPQVLTTQVAQETAAAAAAIDPTEVVFDLFQLMALVLETQMAGYDSGSQRRAMSAELVDKLRWAAAALKDKSVDKQFKASMIKAVGEMVGAGVSAVGSVWAGKGATPADVSNRSAGVQGGAGLINASASIWSAVEQREVGQLEADTQRSDAGAGSADKAYNISNERMQRALELINKLQQFFQQVSQGEIQTNTHMASNV